MVAARKKIPELSHEQENQLRLRGTGSSKALTLSVHGVRTIGTQ
jgi:hypothetical protein